MSGCQYFPAAMLRNSAAAVLECRHDALRCTESHSRENASAMSSDVETSDEIAGELRDFGRDIFSNSREHGVVGREFGGVVVQLRLVFLESEEQHLGYARLCHDAKSQ